MYTRFIIFILLLNITVVMHPQNTPDNKWQQYISKAKKSIENPMNQQLTCLVKFNNKTHKQYHKHQILRILDKEYAIISIPTSEFKKLQKEHKLIWKANNLWKLSNNLLNSKADETNSYIIKTTGSAQLKKLIKDKTILEIVKEKNDLFILRGTFNDLMSEVIKAPYVRYIGLESLTPKQESKIAELDLSVNKINQIHHNYKALTGKGLTISVKDNMFDKDDLDLAGRYISSQNHSSVTDAHATAMATISAGSGNSSLKGKGVAYESSISSSDYNNLLPDSQEQLSALKVSIQNHSYGTTIENFYGALAEAYDKTCYSNPDLLHVFSSGNSGESIPQDGIYKGLGAYSNLTGNFKMAKNTLSVGAIGYNNDLPVFSSKGPAHDGRIKPELAAYSISGTSNSAALVSGLSILLQQHYQNIYGSFPPSSLIKACLINSADDIGSAGPDYASGFGNVNGYQSLQTINKAHFILDSVGDNETKTYLINIPPNSTDLKLTLVWTDPPAAVNSNIALVNDLDLTLIDTETNEWLPWVLNHSASIEKITAPAIKAPDHLNNVEQISQSNLTAGTYTFEVKGFNVASAYQYFAIAYQWKSKDTFVWTCPTGSDALSITESSTVILKWESTFVTTTGELMISYNGGNDWKTIDNQAILNKNNYEWTPEINTNSAAILKMTINGNEFLSDTFVIATETNLKVGLDCNEIIELNWNESNNAISYKIYNLQDNSMVLVAETTGVNYAFNKTDFETSFFSVEPVFNFDIPGQRSETIDYSGFGAGCYFNSVYALSKNDEEKLGVELNVELGSIYQVCKLQIYRINADETQLIKELADPTELVNIYLDTNPLQGKNQYQVKLILCNGKEYRSEIIEVLFLSDKPFLLFPNPTNSKGINIYTKNFGNDKVTFKLYNIRGKHILNHKLISDRDFVDFKGLKNGTYLYKLESSNGITESAILIIH